MTLLYTIALIVAIVASLGYAGVAIHRHRLRLFVRGLNEDQLQALRDARLEYEPGTLRQGAETGILIRRSKIAKACRVLNVYILTIWPSPRPGVKYAELRRCLAANPELAALKVSAIGLHGQANNAAARLSAPMVKLIKEVIAPVVGSSIIIHDQRGQQAAPVNDAKFHIFVHSSPEAGTAQVHVPQALFGYRSRPQLASGSGALGVALVDAVTGYAYGHIVDNCLYIHHDVFCRSGARLVQLAHILDSAAPLLDANGVVAEVAAEMRADGAALQERVIAVSGFEPRRCHILRTLVQVALGDATEQEIVIENCVGRNKAAADDGKFRVLYHGRPIGLAANSRLPAGAGVPIAAAGGLLVAELMENCLYVFADLMRYGLRDDVRNLAAVLMSARQEMVAAGETASEEGAAQRFIRECTDAIAVVAGVTAAQEELEGAESQFLTALEAAQSHELENLSLGDLLDSELGREFDELFNLRQVSDVFVSDDKLIVMTDTIYSRDTNTNILHEIGVFKIVLPLTGNDVARFFNQTRQYGGMHSPHVYADGSACLGNIGTLLPEMIRGRELATAVQVAIAFLESNNPGYNNVRLWPVAANQN